MGVAEFSQELELHRSWSSFPPDLSGAFAHVLLHRQQEVHFGGPELLWQGADPDPFFVFVFAPTMFCLFLKPADG